MNSPEHIVNEFKAARSKVLAYKAKYYPIGSTVVVSGIAYQGEGVVEFSSTCHDELLAVNIDGAISWFALVDCIPKN